MSNKEVFEETFDLAVSNSLNFTTVLLKLLRGLQYGLSVLSETLTGFCLIVVQVFTVADQLRN